MLILIAGVEGAGKGETVNLLNEWMDPRHIQHQRFRNPRTRRRAAGSLAVLARAAAQGRNRHFLRRLAHACRSCSASWAKSEKASSRTRSAEIQRLEKMLCDEGVLLVKYWFHLSKGQQKKRLKALEKDPDTRWRVTDVEWEYFKLYDRFIKVCEPLPARDLDRRGALDRGARRRPALSGADGRTAPAGDAARAARRSAQGACPGRRSPCRRRATSSTCISALELDQKMTRAEYEQGTGRSGRDASILRRATRASSRCRSLPCSRATTAPARAARSGASPRRSTPAATTTSRSPRRPRKSARSPISGGSGATCRGTAA